MERNCDGIEWQRLHRQRAERRWLREGGVLIATDGGACSDQPRLEFSETIAPDVSLQVTFNLREVGRACKFLTDYAIYLWNCTQHGDYGLYEAFENDNCSWASLAASTFQPYRRITATCYAGRYPGMQLIVHEAQQHPYEEPRASLLARMQLPKGVCAAIHRRNASDKAGAFEIGAASARVGQGPLIRRA